MAGYVRSLDGPVHSFLPRALLRLPAPLFGGAELPVMAMAGLSWIAAFGLFATAYGPFLTGAAGRVD